MTGSGGPFRHMIQPPQLDENNRHCFLCIPCTIDYLTFRLLSLYKIKALYNRFGVSWSSSTLSGKKTLSYLWARLRCFCTGYNSEMVAKYIRRMSRSLSGVSQSGTGRAHGSHPGDGPVGCSVHKSSCCGGSGQAERAPTPNHSCSGAPALWEPFLVEMGLWIARFGRSAHTLSHKDTISGEL